MKTWFLKLWLDENFFLRLISVVLGLAAYGFLTGFIPTEIDGAGPKVAGFLYAIALGVSTGKFEIPKEKLAELQKG